MVKCKDIFVDIIQIRAVQILKEDSTTIFNVKHRSVPKNEIYVINL